MNGWTALAMVWILSLGIWAGGHYYRVSPAEWRRETREAFCTLLPLTAFLGVLALCGVKWW